MSLSLDHTPTIINPPKILKVWHFWVHPQSSEESTWKAQSDGWRCTNMLTTRRFVMSCASATISCPIILTWKLVAFPIGQENLFHNWSLWSHHLHLFVYVCDSICNAHHGFAQTRVYFNSKIATIPWWGGGDYLQIFELLCIVLAFVSFTSYALFSFT